MKLRLTLKTREDLVEQEDLADWQFTNIEEELLPKDAVYGKQPATHRRIYSLAEARALGIKIGDSDGDRW